MLNLLKKLAVVLLVLFVAATAYYKVIVKKNVAVYRHHAVPALMYHSISEVPPGWPSEMCINPQLFEAQMKWLKDNGYKAVTVQEARAALMAGEDVSNLIMLTFDDGYKNNYTAAFPILKKYGFKGNFYVIGKDIGKSYKQDGVKEYMDKPMLKEMHEAGMEIGSHTMSHDPLAKIAPHYLPWEIYEPLNVFSRRNGGLHWFIHGIAFPNGSYNDAVLAEVKSTRNTNTASRAASAPTRRRPSNRRPSNCAASACTTWGTARPTWSTSSASPTRRATWRASAYRSTPSRTCWTNGSSSKRNCRSTKNDTPGGIGPKFTCIIGGNRVK